MNSSVQKSIAEMTLYDNDLFMMVMDGNIPLVQRMVRVYLNRDDLIVISVKCEVTQINKEPDKKWGRIDALVKDADGNIFVIEMQNRIKEFPPQRSRAYSAQIDQKLINKGEPWDQMKKSYIIVQCAKDPFGRGEPIYIFERKDQFGNPLNDGSYIIYVNGEYEDLDTDLGKLCHDLKCKNIEDMMYNELRDSIRPYKDKTEGENTMVGRVVEEYGEECREEGKLEGAVSLGKSMGLTQTQLINSVAKSCNTTEEAVKKYLAKMK